MLLSNTSSTRRLSLSNNGPPLLNLTLPEVFSDSREHGYRGPTRHVRLPRATSHGGGSIAKSEDGTRCVVAGRESLRILRMSEASGSGTSTPTEHKTVTGRGGHRIEASRNYWDGSGLKVDSSSTDVAWCHGTFNSKILTSARNGELILWDLHKAGPSKYERRTRDHARSIHVLQYSPILQSYCMTGSADGDLRIWDIRDLTKSIMRIHHPAAVRAVAFSPVSSQSRHVVAALDNGSIYRWDLNMGQRGQLDRIPVAHSGPVLSLDWIAPSSTSPSMLPSTRQTGSSTWYGGAIEEILPSAPLASGTSANDGDTTGPGWIISGGMDRCVKVWDLTTPASRSRTTHQPTYTLHTSFPVRRVLWRPGYECELAVVSNADFGIGTDFGHASLPSGPSSASVGLSGGLSAALSSPRVPSAHIGGAESPRTPEERGKSATRSDGSDPVEIWDVRRGYIAKWVVNGSAVEGGVTDIDFRDSHALWAVHSSGTFSQLDLRQSRKPLDAIPRSAISWSTSGSIAFVTDRPKRWEVPYDDIDPEMAKDKAPAKGLGDLPYLPTTQNVGAFVSEGAAEDLEMIEKLARGYIYEGKEKRLICAHNAEVAMDAGVHDAAQTWQLLESLLIDLTMPPTPPRSPSPPSNPPLLHSTSAPAAIPTVSTVSSGPMPPQRSMTADASMVAKHNDSSPGSRSKYSDERYSRSNSGHRSPRKITPTSSTASSPRKASSALPTVPAAILARRESAIGLPPPMRPRQPSSIRRPSFSTQSILSGHSESPSDSIRNSHRHVGEGALDDSDSSESGSDPGSTQGADESKANSDHEGEVATPSSAAAQGSRAASATYLQRSTTAHPSPLSQVAGKQTWTEDEKEDEDTPSPASTPESSDGDEDDESGDERALASMSASTPALPARRTSTVRMKRRSSTRSKTRSRSSTVASLAVTSAPQTPSPWRSVARQESSSSIRTVTAEPTPAGTISRADSGLKRDDTVRELSGGRPASVRSPQHARGRSEALSNELMLDPERMASMGFGGTGTQTPLSMARTCNDQTKAAIREAEGRLRQLAWETMKERFEQYADEGDITTCAVMSLVLPEELKIPKARAARFVESYIEVLTRLRMHTCAAYLRKFVDIEDIRATTSLQTTVYVSCGRCRKPILQPAGPMLRGGRPSGSYAYCTSCQANVTKCSICRLPVRALMFQCPVCSHGGHQECYRAYYFRRPADDISPPPQPSASLRPGRTNEADPPRGRAMSRTGSTATADGESDDGSSAHGEGAPGTAGSYSSAKGVVVSSNVVQGLPCAAGCGHYCWAGNDKPDPM
ncbi:WD40 repeat-like protein [Pilatotrama ljubarskyi]|nr:WD40 repeat-like protein [Pilatotrama ljubarskyi]